MLNLFRHLNRNYWLAFLLSLLMLAVGYQIFTEVVGDFSEESITGKLAYHPEWDAESVSEADQAWLEELFKDPFTWIGQGRQVYAFVSSDQQYVLKIFKFKPFEHSSWMSYFSYIPFFDKAYERKKQHSQQRFDRLFKGYQLGYSHDRDNTGIRYLHLNHDVKAPYREIVLVDKLGRKHRVNANTLSFAIQSKGRKTKDVLEGFLNQGDVLSTKQYIRRLFEMQVAEYRMGIVDCDHNVLANTGFVGDMPVRLDVGQLSDEGRFMEWGAFKQSLIKIANKRLYLWLSRNYPDVAVEVAKDMEQTLSELFGEPVKIGYSVYKRA